VGVQPPAPGVGLYKQANRDWLGRFGAVFLQFTRNPSVWSMGTSQRSTRSSRGLTRPVAPLRRRSFGGPKRTVRRR